MKPSEVLAKAADLIEPPGAWMQGSYSNGGDHQPWDAGATCWCAAGAILRFNPEQHYGSEAKDWMRHDVGVSIASWNDAPARTQPEVVAALRAASAKAAEAGQ